MLKIMNYREPLIFQILSDHKFITEVKNQKKDSKENLRKWRNINWMR